MSTAQNGWPAPPPAGRLHPWVIDYVHGAPETIEMVAGSGGFLLADLALWFDAKVEDLNGPVLDEWGYAYRAIRGFSTELSNHAAGTAIDLNATKHPLGVDGTFTAAQEALVHKRLAHRYDGCIRWGQDYHQRKDGMHFEINVPLHVAELKARELVDSPRGKRILAANPGQRAVIFS